MRRIVTKLVFLPRPVTPCVALDGKYYSDGSFFLISEKPIFLQDFESAERGIMVHCSKPFSVYFNSESIDAIEAVHKIITPTDLATTLERCKIYLIPGIQGNTNDMSEIDVTIDWLSSFGKTHAEQIYQDCVIRRDKRNQGRKLSQFIYENRAKLNAFLMFIQRMDKPFDLWIAEHPEVENPMPYEKNDYVALATVLICFENLVGRAARYNNSARVVKSIGFNESCKMRFEDSGWMLVQLEKADETREDDVFPTSYSHMHMIASSICAVDRSDAFRERLRQIAARMPENFGLHMSLENTASMRSVHLLNIGSHIVRRIKWLRNLPDQIFMPNGIGQNVPFPLYMKVLNGTMKYEWKDPRVLREARCDSRRLEILGSCVSDYVLTVALCNSLTEDYVVDRVRTSVLNDLFIKMMVQTCQFSRLGEREGKAMLAVIGSIYADGSLSDVWNAITSVVKRNRSGFDELLSSVLNGPDVLAYLCKTDVNEIPDDWTRSVIDIPLNKLCLATALYVLRMNMEFIGPLLIRLIEDEGIKTVCAEKGLRAGVEELVEWVLEQTDIVDELGEIMAFVSGKCCQACFMTQTIINGSVYSFIDTEAGRRLPVVGIHRDKLISQQLLIQSVRENMDSITADWNTAEQSPSLRYSTF